MRSPTPGPRTSHPDGPGVGPSSSTTARAGRPWRDDGLRLLAGAVAAALGLGLCAVVVLLFWIGSARPQHGPDGALHAAAAVWLTAHGAELVRTSTVTGEPAPVGLTPLLLMVLPCWLLARAVRGALPEQPRPPGDGTAADAGTSSGAVRAAGAVLAAYLAVGAAVIAYAVDGPLRVEPVPAGSRFGAFAVLVAATVTWTALGRPVPRVPRSVTTVCGPGLRAGGLATAVLAGGGLLLALLTVLRYGGEALAGVQRLSGTWSGDVGVLLLAVVLLPNAAIWAAAYGLGPGFTLGGGSVIAPLAAAGGQAAPPLPPFPLFAGVPAADAATGPAVWAPAAVPMAAALALGWYVGREAAPVAAPVPPGSAAERTLRPGETAVAAVAGAVVCGAALGVLGALAGGALGTGALAHLGPSCWATGGAALAWTGVVGVPAALGVRAWRLRNRDAAVPRGPGEWHETGARRTRWAALKEASGGLMADFPPRGRDGSP